MILWLFCTIVFLVFLLGLLVGYFYRARQDRAVMILAATYKRQADEMMERLVEIECALQEEDDGRC